LSLKKDILKALVTHLESQVTQITDAAKKAKSDATSSEIKKENKYDTRAIEAGYLADGQARIASELKNNLEFLKKYNPPEFSGKTPIDIGALVEVNLDGESKQYCIFPYGGGFRYKENGHDVLVLSPDSPIAEQLQDLKLFESAEIELKGEVVEVEIEEIE
jgi:transcription elongation GreA/GreB family factor